MGQWVISFAGLALVYAAVATLVVTAAARALGRPVAGRALPVIYTALVFVFMTQHPFPDPDSLACPVETAVPQLQPFWFWATFRRLYDLGAPPRVWLESRLVMAVVMNVVVCAVIGASFALVSRSLRLAAIFGLCLSLAVELSQLTGLWGLYSCAYRQFNVDDLILNSAGVVLGFLLARVLVRARAD